VPYVSLAGPAFSTRAESLANRAAGHAVIGMTNLGEAKCAREAQIAYATLAMVTDYDCWKEDGNHVTLEMIVDYLHRNAALAQQIVAQAIPLIPLQPACSCHSALQNAILTERSSWPAAARRQLALLLPGPKTP